MQLVSVVKGDQAGDGSFLSDIAGITEEAGYASTSCAMVGAELAYNVYRKMI